MITSLHELSDETVWLAWRNEPRGDKLTKVPYAPRGGPGKADDPETWGLLDEAETKAKKIVNGLGGGIGVVLGINCGDDLRLGGLDLDSCRSDEGEIADWALDPIAGFGSYAEISPSGTGVKIFFLYHAADLARLREMMGTQHGRMFKQSSSSDHPPAIEFHISNRYFAVTGDLLDDELAELRIVGIDDLDWLLNEAGPAFAGQARGNTGGKKQTHGPKDGSRSGAAFRLGLRMRREGKSFEEFCEAVRTDSETAEWCREKGEANGGRELHRIWERVAKNMLSKGVSLQDFFAFMPMHNYIYAPTRSTWPGASVNSRIPPVKLTNQGGSPMLDKDGKPVSISASAWLDRNQPVEQMTWAPGLPMIIRDKLMLEGGWVDRKDVACFNLYHPATIEPADPKQAEKWVEHINYVYPEDAEHILNWLAHRVQRPDQKINHSLVLGGEQGIGKDTLLEPVKEAIGRWNFQEASPSQVLGRFNGFLKGVILRISEARDLGEFDRFKFYDHMKAYTAAPLDMLRCDEKNLREYPILNVCGVIITTNHKTDGIYLSPDDRRHYVAWSDRTKDDKQFQNDYWSDLWAWYENGGIQHVAAWLLDHDISGFKAKAPPPKTPAFWSIVDANRASEEAELADVIDGLKNPDALRIDSIASVAVQMGDHVLADWIKDRKNRRVLPHRLEKCGYVPVRNPYAKDGLWKVDERRQAIYAKVTLSGQQQIEAASKLTTTLNS